MISGTLLDHICLNKNDQDVIYHNVRSNIMNDHNILITEVRDYPLIEQDLNVDVIKTVNYPGLIKKT